MSLSGRLAQLFNVGDFDEWIVYLMGKLRVKRFERHLTSVYMFFPQWCVGRYFSSDRHVDADQLDLNKLIWESVGSILDESQFCRN